MAVLFPHTIVPDSVKAVQPPDYNVSEFVSDEGVSTRMLYSCVGYHAALDLEFSARKPDLVVEILKFWKDRNGTFGQFELPVNHRLWEFVSYVDCYLEILDNNLWVFSEKPDITTEVKNTHDITLKLKQVVSRDE